MNALSARMARIKEENRHLRLIIAAQKKIAELFPEKNPKEDRVFERERRLKMAIRLTHNGSPKRACLRSA